MKIRNFNDESMEQNEAIETQIWEFVDGCCDEKEQDRINNLILTDPVWEQKFAEICALNDSLKSILELEQPSLRFSKNVMDEVARVHIAPATRKYIDPRIITGIAVFFLTMLGGLLVFAAFKTNGHTSSAFNFGKMPLKNFDYTSLMKGNMAFFAVAINVVLALVLTDKLLRHRARHRSDDMHAH